MNFSKLTMYRNANIGVFMFANNKIAITPPGLSKNTRKAIIENLDVDIIETTLAGMHIIGVLVAGNDKAIVLPDIVKPEEVDLIKESVGNTIKIEVISTKHTALGNLIAANNKSAYISTVFERELDSKLSEILEVPIYRRTFLGLPIVGSMIVANDKLAYIHPMISDEDAIVISKELGVTTVHTTVNEGVGFVRVGIVMNNKGILVGNATTGPEIMNITSALS